MSVPVEVEALQQELVRWGPQAHLVTVTDERTPHVVSVVVTWVGDALAVSVGRRTGANLADRPAATLLWPAPPGEAYSLLVDVVADGDVVGADGRVVLRPVSAVRHRVAGAGGDGPTCVPVTGA